MKMRVIDLSENNGYAPIEDMAKIYGGFILRLGWGNRHIDEMFIENYKRVKATGAKVGVYYYSYALDVEQAKNEARFLIEVLRENGIKSSDLELGIWFDMEDADFYKSNHGMPSNEDITAMCSAFIVECNKADYWCGIYASEDWLFNVIDTDQLADYVQFWVARWDNDFDFNKNVYLWQYTCEEEFLGRYYDCSYLLK